MRPRPLPDKFLVAFSFAGEQRDLVHAIAESVETVLGEGTVFFDDWYVHYIAGDDADLRLQNIYSKRALLVVPCISARYRGKPWTRAEHRAIRALQMQLDQSSDEKSSLRILPLRVGDGDIDGVLFNTVCLDVRDRPIAQTVELLLNRLRLIKPSVPDASASASRHVFLAECTPDLEDATKPINRGRLKASLEEQGFHILPSAEYDEAEYRAMVEADLRRCLAFVQLLGPYPGSAAAMIAFRTKSRKRSG